MFLNINLLKSSKIFFITIFFYFFLFNQVFASIFISEVLPNTIDDKVLEYIQLYNSGSENINLDGYFLEDKSGKKYNFGTGEILNSSEKKKYYRTQTKIILNNTNEDIYLYNSGSLIDSFTYETSIKGEIISRNFGGQDGSLDSETGSGNTDSSSGSVDSGSGNTDSSSGSIETGTGGNNSGTIDILEIPEIDIEIQSGIEYLTGNTWNCKKEACKVNLSLEKVFTGTYEKNNYSCLWNFGSGALYSTGTESKCNPGYVDYGSGSFELLAKIYEKGNENNCKTGGLIIRNDFWENNLVISGTGGETDGSGLLESGSGNIDNNNTGSGEIETGSGDLETGTGGENTGSGETSSGNLDVKTGSLLAPDVILNFQNPTYLVDKEIKKQNYNCDRTKEECKVNLDLRNSFTGAFKESNYKCQIFFGFGSGNLTGQENKCNPSTVIFPAGNYNLDFKIIYKDDETVFSTGSIKIENKGYIKPVKKSSSSSGGGGSSSNHIHIRKPEIIIQSGLEKQDGKYKCKKENCKINLKYEPKNKREMCLWSFDGGSYKDQTLEKCNPGYIDYSYGNFKIKLKVYEKGKVSNFKEDFLDFNNVRKTEIIEKGSEDKIDTPKIDLENKQKKVAIILQGKAVKHKVISSKLIKCIGVKKCNINLISDIEGYKKKKDLIYNWDFGNGFSSDKNNPKGIWYTPGKYNIALKVYENRQLFGKDSLMVIVEDKQKEFIQEEKDEQISNLLGILAINRVMPNPRGTDNKERIELINKSNKIINLKGCSLDDDIGKGSRAFKFKDDYFLLPNKKKKIYKVFSKINLNNNSDSINLFCNSKLIDSLSWDFSVKEGYYLNYDRLFKNNFKAFVLKVIDGDTLLLRLRNGDKVKLRLIGVDTPENNNYKKIFEKYGKEASAFTKKYLQGKNIIVEIDSENTRDKYGRLLGYIIINGINFNKFLLEKGIAIPYFRYNFKYLEDFDKAYKKAKKEKIGIWADKKLKKILLKEIKTEIKEKEEKFEIINLKDENKNNIPDEFEEIIKIKNNAKDMIVDKKLSKNNYKIFVEKTFKQSIKKTKNGLKITGTTIPFTQVLFLIKGTGKQISTMSDKNGDYNFLIKDSLDIGDYIPKTILIDSFGNEYIFNSKKELLIDDKFLLSLIKKKKKQKQKKRKIKKVRKTSKKLIVKRKKKKKLTKSINLILPKAEAKETGNNIKEEVNVIYIFLLMIISFILTAVIFKRRGLL